MGPGVKSMTGSNVTPIFILSMPRSGSTLLRRLIGGHPDVATTNESWLLIPMLGAIRDDGSAVSDFDQGTCRKALYQFIERLPEGREDYFSAVRAYANELYAKCGSGEPYFVDKCPRYSLIVEQVLDCFPESRCIFLWRNPAAVAASAQRRWGNGRWRADVCRVDLRNGLPRLVHAYEEYGDRALGLRFEDLVRDPAGALRRVWRHLGLTEMEPSLASMDDGMGDSRGPNQYHGISEDPLYGWKELYDNWFRRRWAVTYLKWLGSDLLSAMGYELESLVEEVRRSGRGRGRLGSSLLDLTWYAFSLGLIMGQPDSHRKSVLRAGERKTRVRLR